MSWDSKPLTKADLDEAIKTIENDRGPYSQPNIFFYGNTVPSLDVIPMLDPKEDLTGSFISVPKGEYNHLITRLLSLEKRMDEYMRVTNSHHDAIENLAMIASESRDILPSLQDRLKEVNDKLDEYLIETIEVRYP